ncbi:hypothetical protein Celf_0620 [Cellulomonas fimi ATCC 484]|uniref:Uncharacterized protein n=2 Tax=Cellulomonas fimi TaxID=1708 RepID=F4GYP1_CELFA|nr:hypothetical protein Celf_0620 [Cellulomonas fimi ATCC 484]VEH27217.1 Uncharacterised protein [Cellulomonas fimi]
MARARADDALTGPRPPHRSAPYAVPMRARRAGVLADPRAAAALAGLAALLALAGAASGRVLLHQCLAPVGVGPWGLRLALLQDAADCPDGTYAFGPAAGGAVLLLSVAGPLLVAHLALAASGVGAGVVASRAYRAAVRLLRRWVRPVVAVVLVPAGRPVAVERRELPLHGRRTTAGLPVRGPPVAV